MRISLGRPWRLTVVLAFFVLCAGIFLWFLSGTATRVPLLEPKGYTLTAKIRDVDNALPATDVRMAGVPIGEVQSVKPMRGGALVTMSITEPGVAPLHEGVKVRVGNKSLIGDSYLEITDGQGAPLPEGGNIENVNLSTQTDDVIQDLDPPARAALARMVRTAGKATAGTSEDISAIANGLGDLGREGHTALDAVAAQSEDLRALGRQTQVLLEALDTGQGQIATLVTNAQRVTAATAGQAEALQSTLRLLPGVLDQVRMASRSITELSTSLAPVAANLRQAGPFLTSALQELPATTEDLRGLLPAASGTLDIAPATLERVPTFGTDVRNLVPGSIDMLREANPMLEYAKPYGLDIAAFFVNFNAVFQYTGEAGVHYARLMPFINEASVQAPGRTSALEVYYNPIPKPAAGADPGPFNREYPRVERAPAPVPGG